MSSTSEESAQQDEAQEDPVAGAVQALLDQADDALDGVTPGEDEEDEDVDEDERVFLLACRRMSSASSCMLAARKR